MSPQVTFNKIQEDFINATVDVRIQSIFQPTSKMSTLGMFTHQNSLSDICRFYLKNQKKEKHFLIQTRYDNPITFDSL